MGATLTMTWVEPPAATVATGEEEVMPKAGVEVEVSLAIPASRPWVSLSRPAVK